MKTVLAFLAFVFALTPLQAQAADETKTVVFAAASLKGPLDEAAAAFKAGGGAEMTISYAGSNALAKQIEQGAPAELFISADEDWMNALAEKSLIKADTRVDLLSNTLVLIAPADSTLELTPAKDFPIAAALGDGKLAMADPDAVPAGKYGKAALEALGVWGSVEKNVARAENVRAALALVATGEAPLGIVYGTDAKAEPKVKVLGVFPAETHQKIVYPAAVTATGGDNAVAFLAFLKSEAGWAIFEKAGFAKAE